MEWAIALGAAHALPRAGRAQEPQLRGPLRVWTISVSATDQLRRTCPPAYARRGDAAVAGPPVLAPGRRCQQGGGAVEHTAPQEGAVESGKKAGPQRGARRSGCYVA